MTVSIRSKWAKGIILSCGAVFLLAGGLYLAVGFYQYNKFNVLSEQSYHDREEKFKAHQNVTDAYVLLQKSYKRNEFSKATMYAEYCTNSGMDNTNLGYLVHSIKANLDSSAGDHEGACHEAEFAVSLAKRDRIPEGNLKEYGLEKILNDCRSRQTRP